MRNPGSESVITPEIVRELREVAARGTNVRELSNLIQDRVGCARTDLIPVLAGFIHAFGLPLPTVLPIREWLGSDNDAEIDALILPEIEKARPKWSQSVPEPAGSMK
jgi:hypothetical protein